MKKRLIVSFLLLVLFVLTAWSGAFAQEKAPFAVGERLTYEGKLSKIISGIEVAELVLTVDKGDDGGFLLKAEARSKGTLLRLFRFSFLQTVESTIDPKRFRVLRTVKHDVQKDRIRDSKAEFDYSQRRVTYVETDPNNPMKPPRTIASDMKAPVVHDLISGIYSLRMLPLAVGKSFDLAVSDSGLVYNIPVKVTGRELLKTEIGRLWCFRVEPSVFGPGRLIEKEGSMVIWITDDARRIPVRSRVKTSIGKVDIKIESVSNGAPVVEARK